MAGYSFALIDDENTKDPKLQQIIQKVFKDVGIFNSYDGLEAFEHIQKKGASVIVLCDINCRSINGLQLLKKIRSDEKLKDLYYILINSNVNKDQNLEALQKGANAFINKPYNIDEIISTLKSASTIVNLKTRIGEGNDKIKELATELRNSSETSIEIIEKIQQVRFEQNKAGINRVKDSSEWILKKYSDDIEKDEIFFIKTAARIAFVGKLFLPDNLISSPVMKDGQVTKNQMAEVPKFAKQMTENIRGMKEVTNILYHIYENFDGSGIPESQMSKQIPLGSRILRVALDFEEFLAQVNGNFTKAMEKLNHYGKKLYDFKILTLYDQFIGHTNAAKGPKETATLTKSLESRNVVSRNIVTESGLMIMSAGTMLDEDKIQKIREISSTDPIIGSIYIREN